MSKQKTDWLKRRGIVNSEIPSLYAFDLRTEEMIWSNTDNIFGTWLSYSVEHDMVIEAVRVTVPKMNTTLIILGKLPPIKDQMEKYYGLITRKMEPIMAQSFYTMI